MQRNHITPPVGFTYSVYANGSEILETEDQAIVVVVHPAKGVQP